MHAFSRDGKAGFPEKMPEWAKNPVSAGGFPLKTGGSEEFAAFFRLEVDDGKEGAHEKQEGENEAFEHAFMEVLHFQHLSMKPW